MRRITVRLKAIAHKAAHRPRAIVPRVDSSAVQARDKVGKAVEKAVPGRVDPVGRAAAANVVNVHHFRSWMPSMRTVIT